MANLPDPGALFEGKYLIEKEIGSGGFAAVYRAIDQATERPVAIKILIPLEHESDYSERLVARFEREARLLAGLRSQHTVTLYEFGRSEDDLLYLVFEYVDGTTLQDLVRLKGAQAPDRVVAILRQICTALHEAHQSDILHRDIKPANVMVYDHLEMRDVVKLLDFGIAKPIAANPEADDQTITTIGSVLGTPRYMSPEQLAHQELSPASDIYSLGLVAYELVTGDRAIDEDSVTGILRAQLSTKAIEVPRDRLIPRGLRTVIEKMVAKKSVDRYQDLAAVVRDLEDWDDADLPSGVMRLSVLGLLLGVLLLVVALTISDDRQTAAAVPLQRTAQTLGEPLWEVSLDASGLTFMWLSSSSTYELKGGTDPRDIGPLARAAVAVERDGVPQGSGRRWVGSLLEWDGRTMQYPFVVREISDGRFQEMGRAQMAAVGAARPFVAQVYAVALERAMVLGYELETTQIGWTPYSFEPKKPGKPKRPEDGLLILREDQETAFMWAQARTIRAYKDGDWLGVMRSCGPLAASYRFCARQVARAHSKLDEMEQACYWYDWLDETPAGIKCISTGTRPSYTDLQPER